MEMGQEASKNNVNGLTENPGKPSLSFHEAKEPSILKISSHLSHESHPSNKNCPADHRDSERWSQEETAILKKENRELPSNSSDTMSSIQGKRKRKSVASRPDGTKYVSNKTAQEPRPPKRKRLVENLNNVEGEESGSGNLIAAVGNSTTRPKKTKAAAQNSSSTTSTAKTSAANTSKKIENPHTNNADDASRGLRTNDKGKLTGFFTPAEVRALEDFKVEFCNSTGLPGDTFNRMVHHSDREKGNDFPCDSSVTSKQEFWSNIYNLIPNRDRRSVYRFMKRHFQASTQRPHQWTNEQDEELVSLHEKYGPKWVYIARLLGRSDDDVVQRWKNQLEHRNRMRRGAWLEEEVNSLQEALTSSWNSLNATGRDVGKDIYEMPESMIAWGFISNRLQNCRSRQQCADKWRKITRRISKERARGNPNAVYVAAIEAQHQSKSPRGQRKTQPKSEQFVDSEDEERNDDEQEQEQEQRLEKSQQREACGHQKDHRLQNNVDLNSKSSHDDDDNGGKQASNEEPRRDTTTETVNGPDADDNSGSGSDEDDTSSSGESESDSDSDSDEEG